MQVHITYPPNTALGFWRRNSRAILRSLFLVAGYICLVINLLVGGMPWSLIVIGGLMVTWVIFLYRPQVENTVIKKLSDSVIAVCLYLMLLDSIVGGGWSRLVVPIVFFGQLLLIGCYFLFFFNKRKRDFLPFFELLMVGLVGTLSALIGLRRLNWPMIVVGSVSLALLILSLTIFWKPMKVELHKKFHLKG